MVRSEKFLAASVLTGMTLAVVASAAVQFIAQARAAPGTTRVDIAAERIGGAFASLQEINIDSAIATAATRAVEGRSRYPADCAAPPGRTSIVRASRRPTARPRRTFAPSPSDTRPARTPRFFCAFPPQLPSEVCCEFLFR